MFSRLSKIAMTTGLMIGVVAALQTPSSAGPAQVGHVAAAGDTSVPFGWVDFCRRYRGECDTRPVEPNRDVELSARTFREIERINRWVNANIRPVSDMDHWGVVDQWDYPTDGKGDCEDYALLKRKLLIEEGFPMSALLMTVVHDGHDDGHAILMVRTDHGDFMLDNLNDELKGWRQTGYRFVKRQSQADPNVWVTLIDGSAPSIAAR
jgi:predicted transglutaminase-like cysteine proteinase